jgi:hypothetical protein
LSRSEKLQWILYLKLDSVGFIKACKQFNQIQNYE